MSVVLRDYQGEACDFLVPRKRAFCQAPAGSGKTLIASHAVARVARPGQRVLWLANTKEQAEQGIAALRATPGPAGVGFEVCCAAAEPDASTFDLIVFDEAHHAPAETWQKILAGAKPDAIVWGFSATPWHTDGDRNDAVRAAFKEFFVIERSRVEDSGHLEKGKVYMHDIDTPGQWDHGLDVSTSGQALEQFIKFRFIPFSECERRVKWQLTQDYTQNDENRNALAAKLIQDEAAAGHSVLSLVASVEHGKMLAARVGGSGVVHSKLGAKARRGLIEGFHEGSLAVLFATSLADEGLDVPRASCLVLVAGGRSAGKLEQRVGRVLRPFPGKRGGLVHDFYDRGAVYAFAQARARMTTYSNLGYDPEILRH